MHFLPIISVAELTNLKEYILLDVRNTKDAYTNYLENHLEKAVFVDLNSQLAEIDEDLAKGGRHPLPSLSKFSSSLGNLGVTSESHVVIYDSANGANAAARLWWMLKSVGHDKVQVLDGGFQEAVKSGFTLETGKMESIKKTLYSTSN